MGSLAIEAKSAPSKPTKSCDKESANQENPQDDARGHHENSEKYRSMIRKLKDKGQSMRSDDDQPRIDEKPTWFCEDLFRNAKSVYGRHFMGINFAHLAGLLLLVRVNSIYRTLSRTGESGTVAKLFRRYYHTLKHVKTWYEGDIFDQNSDAHRRLLIVRGMHNKVSSKFNDKASDRADLNGNTSESGVKMMHISQYDLLLTQFAFIGFIVTRGKNMGLIDDFSRRDMESLLHFWRVIGYYLGANDEMNLCSYNLDDVVGLCDVILETEYRDSIQRNQIRTQPGLMSLNIVRSLKFIPMLTFYGMMRYLYELLNIETSEIEDRRTWYSNLSYTLIKLVMSTLLAYRPFRAFNNGLTRLSVHLTGKVEDWFASRLESKYGHELSA